jgi:precorrin-6B methylase 1
MLAVVGIGIQPANQVTREARNTIARADIVLFAVADAASAAWIYRTNPRAESFLYPRDGRTRQSIYRAMIDRILEELAHARKVCAVFYGSPSTFAQPARHAIRAARAAGYEARALPAVSFLECLFTDLAIDPGDHGCHVLEASELVRTYRTVDPYAHVVICQAAVIGASRSTAGLDRDLITKGVALLQARLYGAYSALHPALVYEAATRRLERFRADWTTIGGLHELALAEQSTIYLPPVGPAPINPQAVLELESLRSNSRETASR